MAHSAIFWKNSLVDITNLTEPQLTLMTLLKQRADKMRRVSDWLETLPMHWAYEAGIRIQKPDINVSVNASGADLNRKVQGEHVSGRRLIKGNEEGHEKIKANLEQKMKLVDFEMRHRKRKMAFDVVLESVRAGGLKVVMDVSANEKVEVEEAETEKVAARPVKRVKRARKDVIVVAT